MSRMPLVNPRISTALALVAIAVLSPASADARAAELVIDASMLAGDVTERASGEVRVSVIETFFGDDGEPYRLTLSFPNREHYEAALKGSFEPVALAAFDNVMVRQRTGELHEIQPQETKLQASAQHYLGRAESAICGDVLLRAVVELPAGVLMGVDVHARPQRIQPFQLDPSKNTLPGDCAYDVLDHCDTFAIGGCGGPDCVIVCQFGTFIYTIIGDCREEDVFGPNTCSCNP